jgi:hypothetical protein
MTHSCGDDSETGTIPAMRKNALCLARMLAWAQSESQDTLRLRHVSRLIEQAMHEICIAHAIELTEVFSADVSCISG